MLPEHEHRIELATYGAILVVTTCPKTRPHLSLTRAREYCDAILDNSPLRYVRAIDGIAVFIAFTDVNCVLIKDDGIRRSKAKGNSLFLQTILPIWTLNMTSDEEFQQVVTASVLYCLILATRRFSIDSTPFQSEYDRAVHNPRIKKLFSELR